jgi:O-antigen biosynthesis protein
LKDKSSRIASGARRRIAGIRKGRTPASLLGDLAKLRTEQGFRGLAYRAAFESARALAPPEPPPAPIPSGSRARTHAFNVALSEFYDPDRRALRENANIVSRFSERTRDVQSATWFVPYFDHAYFGGIHTILRFMNWMKINHGVKNRVVMYDNADLTDTIVRSAITEVFPDLGDVDIVLPPPRHAPYVDFSELPPTDIALSTIWYSAYPLLRFNDVQAKFYFVQDFEPAFYPAGTLYALAEATYRFGFAGIVNTPGLADAYRSYGNPTVSFMPSVDWLDLQDHERRMDRHPVQIVLYGRPSTDRNAFELLAAASHRVKERFGDAVRIVSAGEDWDPSDFNLSGVVENLGRLNTIEDVKRLYLASDIGVCCMFSKHPSYQPFEYLSAGMAVVTNINPATTWFLRHEENCLLTEPFPSVIAESIGRFVEDSALRAKTASAGAELISTFDWNTEFGAVWRFITGTDRSS